MAENNYEILAEEARKLFLKYDQEHLIRFHKLEADDTYLYLTYLNHRVRIERKSGLVEKQSLQGDFQPCNFNGILTIYDYLCYSSGQAVKPVMSGIWASVSDLGGIIGAYHDSSLKSEKELQNYMGMGEKLQQACQKLGATPSGMKGDVSMLIPVFEDVSVSFQYWDGDDEFLPNYHMLMDKNICQLMHYETVWYMIMDIKEQLFREKNDGEE